MAEISWHVYLRIFSFVYIEIETNGDDYQYFVTAPTLRLSKCASHSGGVVWSMLGHVERFMEEYRTQAFPTSSLQYLLRHIIFLIHRQEEVYCCSSRLNKW